jgi:hypothetical protein
MLALDLVERVANGRKKVGIGVEDRAVEREFDNSLRLVDRVDLAEVIGRRRTLTRSDLET